MKVKIQPVGREILCDQKHTGIGDIAMSRTEEATAFARKAPKTRKLAMYSSSLTFNRHFNFGMYVIHDALQVHTCDSHFPLTSPTRSLSVLAYIGNLLNMAPSDFAKANINEIAEQLTMDEAIQLIAGVGFWQTHKVDRLGIPTIKVDLFKLELEIKAQS
jgi:hypothetical protein